jgi:preprotein translocase subunit SecD
MPSPYGRRSSNTTVIVAIALAAAVAIALVTTAILLKPGRHDELARSARPLLIQQVVASSAGGCADEAAGGAGVSSLDGTTCFQLAAGLTVTEFERIDVVTSGSGSWAIRLSLLPPDAVVFGRLTTRVYQELPPRNQLALVVDGKVISSPAVQGPILGGMVQIEGNFTKDTAKHIADQLDG